MLSKKLKIYSVKYLFGIIDIVSRAFPEDYDKALYRAHSEALFKGLLIHLDDSSPNIQVNKF